MKRTFLVLLSFASAILFALCAPASERPARPRYTLPDLKVGDTAVDFELVLLDEDGTNQTRRVKLSSWQGKKPVLLFFSSYT